MAKVYSDTMFSEATSAIGNTCAQIHITAEGYASGDPMKSKSEAHESLDKFCREDGIPRILVTNRAREELYGEWGRIVKQNLVDQRTTEPYSAWHNKVEAKIREFKKHHNRIMARHKSLDAFWDFSWFYTRDIRKFLVRNSTNGRPPCEMIGDGRPINISEYMDFDFYQWVKYRDQPQYK